MDAREALGELQKIVAVEFEPLADELTETASGVRHELPAGKRAFGNEFGGGARRGGAQVGHEIADAEVNLVSHGGHRRRRPE
jgi:hypothetical protein